MSAGGADELVVFTVASVNMIQFKLTTNSVISMMDVITRIKLVTSFLPLKLEFTLVDMVSRFCVAMMIECGASYTMTV